MLKDVIKIRIKDKVHYFVKDFFTNKTSEDVAKLYPYFDFSEIAEICKILKIEDENPKKKGGKK